MGTDQESARNARRESKGRGKAEFAAPDIGPSDSDRHAGDDQQAAKCRQAEQCSKEKERVGLAAIILPRLDHGRSVVDDPVQKHELAAAIQPGQQEADRNTQNESREGNGNHERNMLFQPMRRLPGVTSDPASAWPAPGIESRSPCSFSEVGKESTESQHEPLADVEGPKQDLLHALDRPPNRINDGNGHFLIRVYSVSIRGLSPTYLKTNRRRGARHIL